ncbi:glycosyltransferase family 39 protein [Methanocalculus sp. MC3]
MGKKKTTKIPDDGKNTSMVERNYQYNKKSFFEMIKFNRTFQLVFFLTFMGLFLRFYQLGFNSIWLDEASTLVFSRKSIVDIWMLTVGGGGEFHPPLFYWMEHIMLFFGDSEFILRLLPALFGALTIPLFYLAGRELIDKQTGIIASALIVISPFHIYYSQDARSYTMALFFFTLTFWLYCVARRHGATIHWSLFALAGSLTIWTHFYTIIPVGVMILFELFTRGRDYYQKERNILPFAIGVSILGITLLPLIIVVFNLFFAITDIGAVYGVQGLELIISTFVSFSGFNSIIAALFSLLFLGGMFGILRNRWEIGIFLLLIMIITIFISVILSHSMPMNPRYLMPIFLPFIFGMAAVFRLIPEGFRSPHVLGVAVLVLCLIQVPFLAGYYTTYSKNDWRGFSGVLSEITEPGDVIVLVPSYMHQPFNYYYSYTLDGTLQSAANTADDLETIRISHQDNRIFFIVTGDIFAADPSGGAYAWLEKNTGYAGSLTGIHLFVIPE